MLRRLIAALLLCSAPAAAQDFTTLKGHGGPIMGLAVSPSGQVASASFDNSVGLWEGRVPQWLEGHDAAVTSIAFGPQGRLVTGGDDFAVWLWDAATGKGQKIGQHKGKVTSLAVAPNGSFVASGSWDGSVMLWPLDGQGSPQELPYPGAGVSAVAIAPDGGTLYAATSQGRLLAYDLDTMQTPTVLARHGFGINRLALGPSWIAYGAVDGGTRVLDLKSAEQIKDFTLDRRPILAMVHHPETRQLAVGDGEGYIMMIDTAAWRITHDFRAARRGPIWALAFSTDGSVIHAGGIDDVAYSWPVAALDTFDAEMGQDRSFLRDAASMPNGERQFMRKCSICHALEPGPSRKAGPTLHGVFGRPAGAVKDYPYSPILTGSDIVWDDQTINALFDEGPDHYIPGSKMPMQVIAKPDDRADLITYLKEATQ